MRVRAQARVLLASWEGHTGERKGVTTFYLLSTAPRDGPPKEAYSRSLRSRLEVRKRFRHIKHLCLQGGGARAR